MNPIAMTQSARLPQAYEDARNALAQCSQIDECKEWADKAAALASYAQQAKDDELEKMAKRIRARAIRRAGELLKQIEPQNGANQNIRAADRPNVLTRKDAARNAGVSPHQAKQALHVANVPANDFDRQVESNHPPALIALASQGKRHTETTPPKPETWLKGRDSKAFNRALHFAGDVTEYAALASKWDLSVLDDLDEDQRAEVREAIAKIDAIHDTIATRI